MLRSLLAFLTFSVSYALVVTQDAKTPYVGHPEQALTEQAVLALGIPSHEGVIPFTYAGRTYETWYRVFGKLANSSQTPLIGLHGGPGLVHDYLVPLQDLAKSRPVILYDQLGNGHSSRVHDRAQSFWTIDLFIDELVNLIAYFDIGHDFDILGHSWGGILGAEFELRRKPAGLKHLILSNSLPDDDLWSEANALLLSKFPQEVQDAIHAGPRPNREKFLDALNQFDAVHVCTVKPVPEEMDYTVLQMYGEHGDMTVTDAMYVYDVTRASHSVKSLSSTS